MIYKFWRLFVLSVKVRWYAFKIERATTIEELIQLENEQKPIDKELATLFKPR